MAVGFYTDSIIALSNAAIVVTRRVEAARVDGKTQPSSDITFSLDVSMQPADGRDLQRLPEGRIEGKRFVMWAPVEIIAAGPPGVLADLVTWRGEVYEVEHVEPYLGFFDRDHWECIIRGRP